MSFVAMDRNKGCGYAAVARGLDLPPLQFLNNMLVYLKIGSKFNPQHVCAPQHVCLHQVEDRHLMFNVVVGKVWITFLCRVALAEARDAH